MAAGLHRHLGDPLEVLGVGRDDHVDVLRPAHDPPGVHREPTDQDELHLRLREAPQQLVEGRFAQALRAAPANRISMWLRAIPSARLTLIGRRASSHSARARTASPAAAVGASVLRGAMRDMVSQPGLDRWLIAAARTRVSIALLINQTGHTTRRGAAESPI